MLKDLYKEKMDIEEKLYSILRNIKLNVGDINNSNLLTNLFFERDDISEERKKTLLDINTKLKIINEDIFKNS